MLWLLLVLLLPTHSDRSLAQDLVSYVADEKIPNEVKPLIEKGARVLAVENADLNGDGSMEYVLVEEVDENPNDDAPEYRLLSVLARDPRGNLMRVKTNAWIVICSTCGGAMGDPFLGVAVGPKSFTVSHYGGSGWRWSNDYTFEYSRLDRTWQLIAARESSFHAGDPEGTLKTKIYTPPKDYGKIDIADFEPEDYRAQDECPGVMVQGEKNEVRLATVKTSQSRLNFISPSTEKLRDCPSDEPACRLESYLVTGDVVLARDSVGLFRCVTFRSGKGQDTSGFLPKEALIDQPAPEPKLDDWAGEWVRDDEASITVTVNGTALDVKGDASFGAHDPGRVKTGAVTVAEIDEVVTPHEVVTPQGNLIAIGSNYDGTIAPGLTGESGCQVRLRLFGRYLAVDDSGNCGGLNVSFTGAYSRRP